MRTRKQHHWTAKEITELKALYAVTSNSKIAKRFGVSGYAVKAALERFKILGPNRYETKRAAKRALTELPEEFKIHFDAIRAQLS